MSMTAASLIILRYLKENNTLDQLVQLSEKGLTFSDKEMKILLERLEIDYLLIKGSSSEYNINEIHVKGTLCARITMKGERFIDVHDSSFKGNKITELIGAVLGIFNSLK